MSRSFLKRNGSRDRGKLIAGGLNEAATVHGYTDLAGAVHARNAIIETYRR
jgi:hypothetical protein